MYQPRLPRIAMCQHLQTRGTPSARIHRFNVCHFVAAHLALYISLYLPFQDDLAQPLHNFPLKQHSAMETARLRLEPIDLAHLEGFHRIWSDPVTTQWR
jgi:hypothetical protein